MIYIHPAAGSSCEFVQDHLAGCKCRGSFLDWMVSLVTLWHCFFGASEDRESDGNEGYLSGVAVCCGWAGGRSKGEEGAVVNVARFRAMRRGRHMVNESEAVVEFDLWRVGERI